MKTLAILIILLLIIFNRGYSQSDLLMGGISSPPENYKSGTAVLTGINGAINTFSIIKLCNHKPASSNAEFGILTGLLQLTYGIIYAKSNSTGLLATNILMGTTTIIISSSGLFLKKTDNKTALNLLTLPIDNSIYAVGFRITQSLY